MKNTSTDTCFLFFTYISFIIALKFDIFHKLMKQYFSPYFMFFINNADKIIQIIPYVLNPT